MDLKSERFPPADRKVREKGGGRKAASAELLYSREFKVAEVILTSPSWRFRVIPSLPRLFLSALLSNLPNPLPFFLFFSLHLHLPLAGGKKVGGNLIIEVRWIQNQWSKVAVVSDASSMRLVFLRRKHRLWIWEKGCACVPAKYFNFYFFYFRSRQ